MYQSDKWEIKQDLVIFIVYKVVLAAARRVGLGW